MKKRLAALLAFSIILGSLIFPVAAHTGGTSDNSSVEKHLVLFYSPGCPHCQEVEDFLKENPQYDLEVHKYRSSRSAELFSRYAEAYDIPSDRRGAIPTAFMGEDYAVGDSPVIQMIKEKASSNGSIPMPDIEEKQEKHENLGKGLTVAGITGLALVDAVNPCALAVLIILLTSILSQNPERKKEALKSGLAFSTAVMITYLVLGVLIVLGFKSVASNATVQSSVLYTAVGGLSILLGLFNLKDYFRHGAFGFAMEVPFSWRSRMKEIIKSAASPTGAFISGLAVSLFLLPCTSGPYFVAGGLLSQMTLAQALPWLLLYNLIFVLPMIGITAAVYTGFASVEKVSDWREENIEKLHLIAGLILVTIGLGIVIGLI
jgi:cytochrome c biogenesis protein CcdA/thiol-disulfide isomerase/thioredoxin